MKGRGEGVSLGGREEGGGRQLEEVASSHKMGLCFPDRRFDLEWDRDGRE